MEQKWEFKHNLISRENSICVYIYTQIHETVHKKRASWSEYYTQLLLCLNTQENVKNFHKGIFQLYLPDGY